MIRSIDRTVRCQEVSGLDKVIVARNLDDLIRPPEVGLHPVGCRKVYEHPLADLEVPLGSASVVLVLGDSLCQTCRQRYPPLHSIQMRMVSSHDLADVIFSDAWSSDVLARELRRGRESRTRLTARQRPVGRPSENRRKR